ncbi:hypothetical protein [Actinoallomurus rhizosphaericola]|uniref:hypothetical protein n=1 Tax=Actinoallomurus rhizosphaericola TaxID=2952536 RepID=UPI002092E1D0|nr:hypothetical protein [Actinoallomurus rhizosphaericola]MCO5997515.1 hypothetical protein [Actinoallomurus rhizosphaericola]
MRHAIAHDEEVRLLERLSAELARLGVESDLRRSLPGLAVVTDVPGVPLYIFVSESGDHFDWRNAEMRHPVGDVTGAAERIHGFLRREEAADRR